MMVSFVSLFCRTIYELVCKVLQNCMLGSKYGFLMSVCEVGKKYADKLWFVNGLDQSDVV